MGIISRKMSSRIKVKLAAHAFRGKEEKKQWLCRKKAKSNFLFCNILKNMFVGKNPKAYLLLSKDGRQYLLQGTCCGNL